MLVASLEAFLNHIIPNDYKYKTQRTRDGISKEVVFSKKKIESGNVSFNEKLDTLIPKMLKRESFWDDLQSEKISIKNLYSNRKNIIHLKTNAEDDLTAYFDTIDEMLELDIRDCILSSISFMNKVQDKFIEYQK